MIPWGRGVCPRRDIRYNVKGTHAILGIKRGGSMVCRDCLLYQARESDILRRWHEAPQFTKNNTLLAEILEYLWMIKSKLIDIENRECATPHRCLLLEE